MVFVSKDSLGFSPGYHISGKGCQIHPRLTPDTPDVQDVMTGFLPISFYSLVVLTPRFFMYGASTCQIS